MDYYLDSVLGESRLVWRAPPRVRPRRLKNPFCQELRLEESYQEGRGWGNRLHRPCADCGRSLARERFSKTQWTKKRVGDSRCTDCILAGTIASLRFD